MLKSVLFEIWVHEMDQPLCTIESSSVVPSINQTIHLKGHLRERGRTGDPRVGEYRVTDVQWVIRLPHQNNYLGDTGSIEKVEIHVEPEEK